MLPSEPQAPAPGTRPSDSNVLSRLERLPRRVGAVLLVVAGLVIFGPALWTELSLDDHIHTAMLRGAYPAERAPWDLYNLVDDESRPQLQARGILPWWTHPSMKVHFFRPLASLLRALDYALFGTTPFPPHLHSFLWWLWAAFAARALFHRLLPSRAAGLATWIFALAPCHAIPLGWLANREVLVSLALGITGLLAYLRWRESRSLVHAALSTVLFAGAVAAGEYGVAFAGYIGAVEVFRHGDRLWERATGLLPALLPFAVYFVVRAQLGCGAVGSGTYADPVRNPESFLWLAPPRFISLVLDAWLGIDRRPFFAHYWPWLLLATGVLVVAIVAAALRPALADLPRPHRATIGWLLLGSLLSLVPMLAAAPATRLLGVAVLGIAGVVGTALSHAWFETPASTAPTWAQRLASLSAVILGMVHLLQGPIVAWEVARGNAAVTKLATDSVADLNLRLGDVATNDLVLVRGGGSASGHLPFAIDPEGAVTPRRYNLLSQTGHVLVRRTSRRRLELTAARNGALIPLGEANVWTDATRRFEVGDVYRLPNARVTVKALNFGVPRSVTVDFDHDLDVGSLRWFTERSGTFVESPPPRVGMGLPHGS
ncbi:MAG: hypothetical protein IV100_12775 [Myxococcales bacterium]|nr:hypothetical protein [Myxococcales bacterium]